jgi:predicted transcriptional regulator
MVYDIVYNQAQIHMSTTMTIRLDDDVKDRLDVLAGATQRSKSFLAAEAIRAFVETNGPATATSVSCEVNRAAISGC